MEREVELTNPSGLHARPASTFVGEAAKFHAQIWVEVNGKRVDAKSILGLLTLSISRGTKLKIIAEGSDEAEAVDSLCKLVESGLGEDS